MCLGFDSSQKNLNILCGIAASLVLTILQIYQFIQLSFDGEINAIRIIVVTWGVSKLLSLKTMFEDFSPLKIIYYFLSLIFQAEWYFNCESIWDSITRIIGQQIVLTFPTTIVNIYLLSDTSRDITHGYYIAMIFINFIILGICIVAIIIEYDPEFSTEDLLICIPSTFANFSFLYLLTQSFLYNKYIGISLIIFNFLIGVVDYFTFRNKDSYHYYDDEENKSGIFINLLQYIFQINCFKLKSYSNWNNELKLIEWEPILKLGVQCLNIFILILIKLSCYPLIIQLDKAFYVFFAFSLPQFYFFAITILYKLTKQISYNLNMELGEQKLKIEKKAFKLLNDRYTQNYGAKFIVNIQSINTIKSNYFRQNIKKLKYYINEASECEQKDIVILINDINNLFNIKIHKTKNEQELLQTIKISESFYDFPNNILLMQFLSLLMKQGFDQKVKLLSPVNKAGLLLIDLQAFNKYIYEINGYNSERCKLLNEQLSKIMSSNQQILAFFKNVSPYIPINPTHLLYDLYSDNI